MNVAYVGRITETQSIPDADRVMLATVVCGEGGKWQGVVGKDQFAVGDKCNVFLQDAIIPESLGLTFLKSSRIKMARFRGAPSECLITKVFQDGDVGLAVDGILGVEKYEKPVSVQMAGQIEGSFPTFIPKTDEPNFQTVPEIKEFLKTHECYSTLKYDGTSCTVYKYQGHFGVCSRNLELKDGDNIYWKMVRQYGLEGLAEGYAIQFEIYGEGIQKNPLGITGNAIAIFNLYDIEHRCYVGYFGLVGFHLASRFPVVHLVKHYPEGLGDVDDDTLRLIAEGVRYGDSPAEGIVIRSTTENVALRDRFGNPIRPSMKVISLSYKG